MRIEIELSSDVGPLESRTIGFRLTDRGYRYRVDNVDCVTDFEVREHSSYRLAEYDDRGAGAAWTEVSEQRELLTVTDLDSKGIDEARESVEYALSELDGDKYEVREIASERFVE